MFTVVLAFFSGIVDTVRRHALLLALLLSTGVLLSGGAALSGGGLWWVPALITVGLVLGFVLHANAPVVLKSAAVLVLLFVLSASASMTAAYGAGLGGVVWSCSLLLLASVCLTYSYCTFALRSRWAALAVALVADYAVTIAVAFGAGWSLTGSALVGLAAGVAVFGFLFRPRSTKRAYEGMDVNYMGERELAAIVGNVELAGGSAVAHVTDRARNKGGVVAYSERAFYLYPVRVDDGFAIGGRRLGGKGERVSYRGRDITGFVERVLVDNVRHVDKSAPIALVLLDLNRRVSRKPMVFSVNRPDSRHVLPVFYVPASGSDLRSGKVDLLALLEDEAAGAGVPVLSERDRRVLDRLGCEGR